MSLPNATTPNPIALSAAANTGIVTANTKRNRVVISNLDVNPVWISGSVMTGANQGLQINAGQSLSLSLDDYPSFVAGPINGWSTLGANIFVDSGKVAQ